MRQFLVQVGVLGQVGRFRALDGSPFRRGEQVVCRTRRGLEVGRLLARSVDAPPTWDGDLIRPLNQTDQLLVSRLRQRQQQAADACQQFLTERKLPAILLDVEPLFDGQSLYFYFLGDVSAEVEQLTHQLARAYDTVAQLSRFGQTLEDGCGPDCGTGEACGDTCAGCAVAGACGAPRGAR